MDNAVMTNRADKPDLTPAIFRRFLQIVGSVLLFGGLLFVSAGRLNWLWAWAYLGLTVAMLALNAAVLMRRSPELVAERSRGMEKAKGWDKTITTLMVIPGLALYVVPGLDVRFGWSAPVALWVHFVGLLIVLLGNLLVLWAMAANTYFAKDVRIQDERSQTVADGGPYRLVRHPGYVGMVIGQLALALVLGSWWTLVPAALSLTCFVARTALEDRTLQAELPGYREYAQRTRYRLLPGVW
jgi:protein-S-isoprenylcysteine O-methyltransferase Ste14